MHDVSRTFHVRWSDVDANGHARNTSYSEYATDVRVSLFAASGFDWARFQAAGIGPVILREDIEYLRETMLGEALRVDMHVVAASPDGARWRIRHDVVKESGEQAARLTVTGGWLDLQARRLVVPPPDLQALLRSVPRAEPFEELPRLRRPPG